MDVASRTRVLWFSTLVAAAAGGVLGSRFWDLAASHLLVVVTISELVGVLVAFAWLTRDPEPVAETPAEQVEKRETEWWKRDTLPATAESRTPSQRQEFDARRAQVAHCPRCGGFELDVHRVERGYAFRCRNGGCGNTWDWALGRTWPAVVVRRNLSGPPPG